MIQPPADLALGKAHIVSPRRRACAAPALWSCCAAVLASAPLPHRCSAVALPLRAALPNDLLLLPLLPVLPRRCTTPGVPPLLPPTAPRCGSGTSGCTRR